MNINSTSFLLMGLLHGRIYKINRFRNAKPSAFNYKIPNNILVPREECPSKVTCQLSGLSFVLDSADIGKLHALPLSHPNTSQLP